MGDYKLLNKNGDRYIVFKDTVVNKGKWGLYKVRWGGCNDLISLHDSRSEAIEAL